MKIILEIQDNKVPFIMELLKNFKFVKAEPLVPSYSLVLEELKESVENMKLVSDGKLTPKPIDDLLNEL